MRLAANPPRWDIEPRQDLKSANKPRTFKNAKPTNLHRYQESEYAAGREISAFRLEFVAAKNFLKLNGTNMCFYLSGDELLD
jgi:hypothetical protein